MTSKIKFLLKLKSVLCLGFIISTGLPAFARDKGPDTPYSSSFRNDGSSIHFYSKGKDRRVIYIKGKSTLYVKNVNSRTTYALEVNNQKITYSLHVKGSKIGALVYNEEVQYNEDSKICKFNKDLNDLVSKEIKSAVEKISVKSTFADDTCEDLDPDVTDEIVEKISNTLNPNTAYALKCLKSEAAQAVIQKSDAKIDLAFKVLAKYQHEVKQVEDGNGQLRIGCTTEKKAKFDPTTNTISLPIEKGELVIDRCKNTSQVLAHEMFHRAGLTQTEANDFDNLCAASLGMPSTKVKACGINASEILNPDSKNKGTGVTKAVQDVQKKANISQQIALTEALKKEEIKTAEFIPVQDSDIQEITNPTSSGAYQASVDRVYNSMSSNMEKMAAPLNRAIASTVTTARAEKSASTTSSERSISKTTIAGLRQPASAKSNDNEEYVVEEILADKYNVPVSEVRAAAVAAGVAAPGAGTTQTVATRSARSPATAAPGAGGNEIAGGGAGPGGGQASTASTGGSSSTAGGVPGRSVSSGPRGNSRLPASSGSQAAGTDPLVEQLGQFNEVRGRRYQQIQERYDDPTFEPELKAKNIAIEYRRNNKTTIIGETSNSSSRTLFRDDGTVLKKISGAK